ncbi:hypothetical protein [Alcaligenes faecalis]|uniref:Uncharacterized protein n=1 Tax=Alcaligenes faecalis TaxID=511 RepID=A0AAE9H7N7_ALCFA|nr:hypothetical protein [Alcaligenes faecalis]UPL20218.1 hypothetical protein MXF72_12360 [Alcaligenes faecalis]
MKTADERIAALESMVIAILPIALLGAHGTAQGNLHSILCAMAANQDLPEGAREALSKIASELSMPEAKDPQKIIRQLGDSGVFNVPAAYKQGGRDA